MSSGTRLLHASFRHAGGAALVAGILALALPAGAFDADCPFGVNAHQASNDALDLAAAAGIGWVRFDMNWFQFQPAQDTFDWTESDRFVEHAAGLGQHVFLTLAYTPAWAAEQPCNDADADWHNWCHNALPADPASWTAFVTAVVERYQDTVAHYGMWNEPNLGHFFRGTREQYVDLILVPGSDAVHAACPECLVLGPELANLRSADWDADEGVCVADECAFNGWNHSLIQILDAASGSIDVITHHKYEDPAAAWWKQLCDGEFLVVQIMNGVKEIVDAHGDGQPVWITELGWETGPFGDDTQTYAAEQLAALYAGYPLILDGTCPGVTNQPWPALQKLFWYDLTDDPVAASWGLLDSDLEPKEAYGAYAQVIGDQGGCEEEADTDSGTSDVDTDADGDTDTDTDGDTDTDADGDTDTDADGDSDADGDADADGASGEDGGSCGCGAAGARPGGLWALLAALR